MDNELTLAIKLLATVLGSSVLVTLLKNSQVNRLKHKHIIAEASKSVFKRVEMYYRIRRRTKAADDVVRIRDAFHLIQEENEYYKTLLTSESKWHGQRYAMYITAIQKLTVDQTRDAWKQKPFGPDAEISKKDRPNHKRVNELSMQFAHDSRRLMNPAMRILMCLRDSWLITRLWKVKVYEP